jgi:hypothetical protein
MSIPWVVLMFVEPKIYSNKRVDKKLLLMFFSFVPNGAIISFLFDDKFLIDNTKINDVIVRAMQQSLSYYLVYTIIFLVFIFYILKHAYSLVKNKNMTFAKFAMVCYAIIILISQQQMMLLLIYEEAVLLIAYAELIGVYLVVVFSTITALIYGIYLLIKYIKRKKLKWSFLFYYILVLFGFFSTTYYLYVLLRPQFKA